jgi:hypothetical protein
MQGTSIALWGRWSFNLVTKARCAMFATRARTLELEAIKWVILMILAMALMMILTKAAGG